MSILNDIVTASNGVAWTRPAVLVHSARTAIAAVASLLVAGLFRLPEAYWAPITTLVITQSSLVQRSVFPGSASSGQCLER
jgi:hypothetical protein